MSDRSDLPGSDGEKDVQEQLGTTDRADAFYDGAMQSEMNERMIEFVEAYIHCAKHIPKMKIEAFDPPWGTDDPELKKVGYFTSD